MRWLPCRPVLVLLIIGMTIIAVRQFRRRRRRRRSWGRDDRVVDIDADADDQHAATGAAGADRFVRPEN